MIEELDCVIATRSLSDLVPEGTLGAVVMVYSDPTEAYEVEFFDQNGDHLCLLTVENDTDLKVYWKVSEAGDTP